MSSSKFFFLLCALVQGSLGQCINRAAFGAPGYATPHAWSGTGIIQDGLAASAISCDGLNAAGRRVGISEGVYPAVASALEITPTTGGALAVTSSSAIPPTGISVVSDNAYEGALAVAGELPFVGTAAVEGEVPSAGAGAINHACGDGVTAMTSETASFVSEAAIAPVAEAVAPTTAALTPILPLSPANRFGPNSGLGLGNRFPGRGCGGRGLMY
ncbi:unnamed protein product [Arctia plantaginis]|uniref:Uncharacterized protein n=1 Tax=Arctia plantaginis TaxID=874455 RepID=A0A8S1A9W9_ARCPL|nr:unnamed protein product [Arctia plantaginis]